MIFRILFLTIFSILSTSCSFPGFKSSSESTTSAAQDKSENARSPEKTGTQAEQTELRKPSKVTTREWSKAKRVKSLELPPDLVGSSNNKVQQNTGAFAETRVLPTVVGARINKQGGRTWLEIDTNVESAWQTITQYWASNGIDMVDYNPEAGTMETDWIKKDIALKENSAVKQMFKNLLATISRNTALDKYRIRFERISENQTAMYVSHRASVRKAIVDGKKITTFEWVELPSNPERIADFLQNIILIFDQTEPA